MENRNKMARCLLKSFKDVSQEKNLASIHQAVAASCAQIFCARKANIYLVDHTDPKLM